jgi:type IV pilus assembly protein PilB
VIPLSLEDDLLKVAMTDPLNVFAIDDLEKTSGYRLSPSIATETEIKKVIAEHYGGTGAAKGTIDEIAKEIDTLNMDFLKDVEDSPEKLEKITEDASVVKLVNMIISQSVKDKASDIHVEPDIDTLRVRMRVDGILNETANLPLTLHAAVVSRIKVLGNLNIAEKRLPQDGRFQLKIGTNDIDFRLSTMPTVFGEKIVLRLLDKSSMILKFDQLAKPVDSLEMLKSMTLKPYGMILIAGPTGSGKTTTAYTILNVLNTMDKNIITVEDPVEYRLKIINQVQINHNIGLTFATVLRNVLRQDPDIVMIGEIRDRETVEIAVHAALTGHRVISTIHTNDAIGTISRLIDMGVEPFLIASSIICVVNQRLIRTICNECKVSYTPEENELRELNFRIKGTLSTLYKGKGCPVCKESGYKGRLGIFETLVIDKDIQKLILAKADSSTIMENAVKKGFKSLRYNGLRAVIKGYTTIDEIVKATQDIGA